MTQDATAETTLSEDMREGIRAIVVDVLEVDPAEITETSDFVEDHEADSLLAIDIVSRLERDLGVAVPQDELPNMTDLAALYAIVERSRAVR